MKFSYPYVGVPGIRYDFYYYYNVESLYDKPLGELVLCIYPVLGSL